MDVGFETDGRLTCTSGPGAQGQGERCGTDHEPELGDPVFFGPFEDFVFRLLQDLKLGGCDLRISNVSGSILRRIDAIGANFTLCSFSETSVLSSDLSNADFEAANLFRTGFDSVLLRGASFRNASMDSAAFNNVDLSGADFTGATDLDSVTWDDVVCPDGTRSDRTADGS